MSRDADQQMAADLTRIVLDLDATPATLADRVQQAIALAQAGPRPATYPTKEGSDA